MNKVNQITSSKQLCKKENLTSINLPSKLEHLIAQCKEAYSEHLLDNAYRTMLLCEKTIFETKEDEKKVIEGKLQNEKELFETIRSEYNLMQTILRQMGDHQGWQTNNASSVAKSYYKYLSNSEYLSLKLEMDVDLPIQTMIILVSETNLWNQWMPFIKTSTELKKIKRNSVAYYLEFMLPYPLHNRQAHLYGMGVNRLHENGTVFVFSKSIEDDIEFFAKHELRKIENQGTVNLNFKFGAFEITPIGQNKCKLRGIANINSKMNWLPPPMLNYMFRRTVQFGMDRLVKKAKHFKGSVWDKEIEREERKDYYIWLNQIIKDYFNGNELKPKL